MIKVNKTAIGIFSISMTAGTAYMIYLQFKHRLIAKLLELFKEIAEKKGKKLKEKYLNAQLDNLHYLDLHLLYSYTTALMNQSSEETALKTKIERKGLALKTDLESLNEIIF